MDGGDSAGTASDDGRERPITGVRPRPSAPMARWDRHAPPAAGASTARGRERRAERTQSRSAERPGWRSSWPGRTPLAGAIHGPPPRSRPPRIPPTCPTCRSRLRSRGAARLDGPRPLRRPGAVGMRPRRLRAGAPFPTAPDGLERPPGFRGVAVRVEDGHAAGRGAGGRPPAARLRGHPRRRDPCVVVTRAASPGRQRGPA